MITASPSRDVLSRQSPEITIRVASNRWEREGAFRLAYQSYLRAELCSPSQTGMRITPHQLLPSTDVIIAASGGEIISTLSLVRDAEQGLPLETIYPAEVQSRRAAGLRLAEVSCLADRRQDPSRYFGLFCELARVMVQMADREGIDQLLIAVHPRHARLYIRAMAFDLIGKNAEYPIVNGNPAVPLALDIDLVKHRHPGIWTRFAGEPLPPEVTQPQPVSDADHQYFQRCLARAEKTPPLVLGTAGGRAASLSLSVFG